MAAIISAAPTTVIFIVLAPTRQWRHSLSPGSESLKAAVENARLNESRLGPEPAAALRTSQAIPPLHLFDPCQKTIVIGALEQAVEFPHGSQTKYGFAFFVSRTSLGSVQTGQGNIRFLPLSAIENPFATWKYARCPLSILWGRYSD